MRASRKAAVCVDAESQTHIEGTSAVSQTDACAVHAWQSDCRIPVLPSCSKVRALHAACAAACDMTPCTGDAESSRTGPRVPDGRSHQHRVNGGDEVPAMLATRCMFSASEETLGTYQRVNSSKRLSSRSGRAVSIQISMLVETAVKDSCAMMKHVSDRALDLQDRQVHLLLCDARVCIINHSLHFSG